MDGGAYVIIRMTSGGNKINKRLCATPQRVMRAYKGFPGYGNITRPRF
jgi:hypothetical protein